MKKGQVVQVVRPEGCRYSGSAFMQRHEGNRYTIERVTTTEDTGFTHIYVKGVVGHFYDDELRVVE